MKGGSGIDLTREVRKIYSNKEISIIGHSAYGNAILSADFLKNGANDFLTKPFQKEELINRVLIQLDMINYIENIKDASEKDFLTSIFNRKYVYEVGRKLFKNAKRGNIAMACAMIDIDHFKNVNDTYGHDIGDQVIVRLAQELSSSFRESDIVGRIGGEEFCVVLTNPDLNNLENIFDEIRQTIEKIVIYGEDEEKNKFSFNFTVSIGVTAVLGDSFEEMLKFSDMKLYEAKNYGRNMVVL
jgi:diguanylate cyclase (GGDEF)-like protein